MPLQKVYAGQKAYHTQYNAMVDFIQDDQFGHDHSGNHDGGDYGKPVDHDNLVHRGDYLHDRAGVRGYSLDQIADFARGQIAVDNLYNLRVMYGAYRVKNAIVQLTDVWKFSKNNGTTGLHSDFQRTINTGFGTLVSVQAQPLYYPGLDPSDAANTVTQPNNSPTAGPQPNYWGGLTILTQGLPAGQFCMRISGWAGWRHGWPTSGGTTCLDTDGWNHHASELSDPNSDVRRYSPWVSYVAIGY